MNPNFYRVLAWCGSVKSGCRSGGDEAKPWQRYKAARCCVFTSLLVWVVNSDSLELTKYSLAIEKSSRRKRNIYFKKCEIKYIKCLKLLFYFIFSLSLRITSGHIIGQIINIRKNKKPKKPSSKYVKGSLKERHKNLPLTLKSHCYSLLNTATLPTTHFLIWSKSNLTECIAPIKHGNYGS